MTAQSAASAAYIVAALLFILALAGLSRHETAPAGNMFGIAGMAIALVATLVLTLDGRVHRSPAGAVDRRHGRRRSDRPVPGRPGAHDRHARADRAVPQLRRPRRGAGGLERLPRGRGPRPARSNRGEARPDAAGHPPRRGGHRRVHRRGDLHRLDRRLGQALRAVQVGAAGAARQEPAEPRRAGRVRRAHGVVRHRPDARGAHRGHRHRAGARRPSRRLDRRRRHARRRVHAQQLLRLGRGGLGLPARQRPADHHRCARRLLRCVPVLHHVQGDEPLVHLRHRGWLRHRGAVGRATRTTASTARSTPRPRPSCSPRHRASSSPPATAWPSPRPSTPSPTSPAACGTGASTCASASIPWPVGSPAT